MHTSSIDFLGVSRYFIIRRERVGELHTLTHMLRQSLKRNYLTIPGTCHQSLTNISPDQRATGRVCVFWQVAAMPRLSF